MLFRKNNISEELKEKYKLILENVYNENKYVNFEENCQIINSINELEKIDSKFKAIILQSKLNNLKQDECYGLFELNKKYIEEYMQLKDDIQMYESRNGHNYPLNPFENLKIMIMLEKDEKIFSKDEIFFCGKEELQSNFIDVLKYHFIPEVITDIEKALEIKVDNIINDKYEVYQIEVGILLEKDDPEYECYNKVWDYKHGYYNEDWGFYKKIEEAKRYITNYVKDGCKNTYGIISKISVSNEAYNICEEDTVWVDMDYNLENVIYNVYKNDKGEITENFIENKKNLKRHNIETEEEEVL